MRLRYVLAVLCVSGCRCAELPGSIFECGPNGECPEGLACIGNLCLRPDGGAPPDAGCVPTVRCTPDLCGQLDEDGCGQALDCGACQEPFTCGLLEPNRCGCLPFDAGVQVCPGADAGAMACGSVTVNNCGTFEAFECGPPSCPGGEECHDNLCCVPPPDQDLCASGGFGCGPGVVIDRCGTRRLLDCGKCDPLQGLSCVWGDEGSHCEAVVCAPQTDFELCNSVGANCGALVAMDNCGAVRNASCGADCDAGDCDSTMPNQCHCQPALSGCALETQCCSGLDCAQGRCCGRVLSPCGTDGECCAGFCQLGACCAGAGAGCSSGPECCSGACGSDGGCQYVDAGSTWDGGEL